MTRVHDKMDNENGDRANRGDLRKIKEYSQDQNNRGADHQSFSAVPDGLAECRRKFSDLGQLVGYIGNRIKSGIDRRSRGK
mgnify:CR=1 FL=1